MPRRKPPELTFQQHIADYLVREHGYGVLEQSDITDTEHCIAEDHLWSFLTVTQADSLKKLKDDYGTDARDEVFKALRKELEHTPLWMLLRKGLKVRGLEFRLFYPKPRSAASAAAEKHAQNRITFRPHFYFGETNQEIDFVIYLNGLPIVALELLPGARDHRNAVRPGAPSGLEIGTAQAPNRIDRERRPTRNPHEAVPSECLCAGMRIGGMHRT